MRDRSNVGIGMIKLCIFVDFLAKKKIELEQLYFWHKSIKIWWERKGKRVSQTRKKSITPDTDFMWVPGRVKTNCLLRHTLQTIYLCVLQAHFLIFASFFISAHTVDYRITSP